MGTHVVEREAQTKPADRRPLRPDHRRHRVIAGRIVREALLLAVMYGIYSAGRIYAAAHSGSAFDNAHQLLGWEQALGMPSEAGLQRAALQVPHLIQAANTYYAWVHFPLTAAVLIWLSVKRPYAYPRVRWTMIALTGMALVGHTIFPLAPPRMLPELGFVDTGITFGQSVYGPDTDSGMANQFAAMPSLHVGWAVMVAIALVVVTRGRWRWLWIAHPVVTFAVVVVTANHYWLDGLVAMAMLACCLPILADRKTGVLPRRTQVT